MQIKETLGLTNKALENKEQSSRVGRSGGEAATASGAEAQAASGDRIELSGRSRELAKAYETASSTSEVRRAKVEEIKRQIENNEYEVPADKVAQKMIVDFLGEIV